MQKDPKVLAAINLHAILRTMEDLCELDSTAAELIQGAKTSIRFVIPEIKSMVLDFRNGQCKAHEDAGASANMSLRFTGPEHFNRMVDGQANPIPTRGFSHIGFLKNSFTQLAERLTAYLKPDPSELAADPEFKRSSTLLTAYVAFFALAQVAELDPLGQVNASRIADGNILIQLEDVGLTLKVRDHHISVEKGSCPRPDATMHFSSIDVANGILSGTLDSYACIGNGSLAISGTVPMVDDLNKLLAQVSGYLS